MQVDKAIPTVRLNTEEVTSSEGPPVLEAKRRRKSLADDVTETPTPSVSTKQPSDYQVLVESCEWCMVETPWTGEDDDDIIEAAVERRSSSSAVEPIAKCTASTPKHVTPSTFGGAYTLVGKSGKIRGGKTFGPRMFSKA